jgi:thiol-disulfide isomerase/thioredoxin
MPRKRKSKNSNLPRFLIIAGLALLVALVLMLKDKPQVVAVPGEIAEVQLARALKARQPTLAFYHSTNCQQCLVMMDIIDEVYPEYNDSITLVDIDVYDERNIPLMQEVGLQYIPTLMFYNNEGERFVHIGVMEAVNLHQALAALE